MRAPYRSARRLTTVAHNVLVVVTLEDGIRGLGECSPAAYVTGESQANVVAAIERVAAELEGADADVLADGHILISLLPRLPGACGAVEMALEDARARADGRPFLAADADSLRRRGCDRATDLSLPLLPPDEAGERAGEAARMGFRALKIKIGAADGADEDAARVRAVAAAAPDAGLRLDGNQGFTSVSALAFIESVEDLIPRITLLEQPTPAGDDAAMRHVAERVPFPVFADESVHSAEDARRLLDNGVCGGLVLKLAKSGIVATRRIAGVARDFEVPCLFGCMMETHLGIGAALRLAIALGSEVVPYLDLDGHLLVDDSAEVSRGFVQERDILRLDPKAIGLGVDLRRGGP
jgi:L-alanine-DL-glutamate epimerase-like enolase superfamily enzyme